MANIARVCEEIDAWLIHVSTNYVFDGNASTPYREHNYPNAKSVYALSKLKGEMSVRDSGCKHIIIRTAWVFSEYGKNFLKTMLSIAKHQAEIDLVTDQQGNPTYGQDLAGAILACVRRLNDHAGLSGIYHYCGDQVCTWFEFAELIFAEARLSGWTVPATLKPVKNEEYKAVANRPSYGVMDCSKFQETFRVEPSDLCNGIASTHVDFTSMIITIQ